MALQTKTFSKSNNTFTLKLTVTENSTSVSGNSSSVSYKLELISTTKDFYQYGVGASVSLNGRVVATRDRYSSEKINLGTYSSVTLLSGSTTIGHNNDGSKTMNVAYSLDMASASYTPGPMSGSGSMPLTTIPREAKLTSAPNFTDEDNPTIQYFNPGGFPIYAYMEVASTGFHPAEPRQVFGSSYTFVLTELERNALRSINTASNTQAIRFVMRTDIGTTPYYSWLDRTLTIKNPAPTLSPTVEDTNSTTVALTGGRKIVRYASNARCTFNDAAVKFSTIKSRKVTCGGKSLTANGTISGATSGDFDFSTTDSRGNTTSKRVSLPLVQYILPTCYIGNNVPNAVGEYELECTGSVFVGSFGTTENNVSAEYRYREKGAGEWGLWIPLSVRTSGQTYTATANLSGLDYQKTYEFQCRVIDRLNTVESDIRVVVSRPVFDWSANDFIFHVPVSAVEHLEDGSSVAYSLLGMAKALSTQYQLDTTVTKGTNYTSVTGYAQLVGNSVRCNILATRSSNTGTGNIGNETVCSFTIRHGGKIKNLDSVSFVTGASGGAGFFQMEGTANSGTTATFKVTLAAAASTLKTFNAYFVIPVTLDFSKF